MFLSLTFTFTGVGPVQLGEEKAREEVTAAFRYLKGSTRKLERDFSSGHVVIGQGRMAGN